MVDVGGRNIQVDCRGVGSATVLIETGGGTPSAAWSAVAQKISEFARVCTYDRAGYGGSDPAPPGRTIQDRASELKAVLKAADEPGPYVLVGHSYGGLIVRLFAQSNASDVVGVVLVDAAEEGVAFAPEVLDYFERSLATLRQSRDKILQTQPDGNAFTLLVNAMDDEAASYNRTPQNMRKPGGFGPLPDVPLVVIAHGKPFLGDAAVVEAHWMEGQRRLANLSRRGVLIVATNSDHNIHGSEPGVIVDAVRSVLQQSDSEL